MLLTVFQKMWDHLPDSVQMVLTVVFTLAAMLAVRGMTGPGM